MIKNINYFRARNIYVIDPPLCIYIKIHIFRTKFNYVLIEIDFLYNIIRYVIKRHTSVLSQRCYRGTLQLHLNSVRVSLKWQVIGGTIDDKESGLRSKHVRIAEKKNIHFAYWGSCLFCIINILLHYRSRRPGA